MRCEPPLFFPIRFSQPKSYFFEVWQLWHADCSGTSVSNFFDGYYESFGKMNIKTILPPLSLLNRRRKKWVYPKRTRYSVKKLLTSDFGTLIAYV